MAVCSDMLEVLLGPIPSTCKPSDSAQQSISEDSEHDRAKNGKLVVLVRKCWMFRNLILLTGSHFKKV